MRLPGVSFFKKIVDLQFADFARDNPELFFEHAGEILRIFKTQSIGHFRNGSAFPQNGLGFPHQKAADVPGGATPGVRSDQIPEVIWREE